MTPVFPARRRAEEFDTLVEGSPTEGRGARYPELLEIVAALRDVPDVEPRPEFSASLRDRLMAAADTLLVPADGAARDTEESRLRMPGSQPSRQRRLAVAVGSIAIVGATTSMAVAAQSALPGDALYPLKRAIENAHAGLSVDDAGKGSTVLASATDRLREAEALSREGRLEDAPAVAQTLDDFSAQAGEAADLLLADYAAHGDQASVEQLHAFTADSLAQLTQLEPVVPVDARDELLHAAQVLDQIDAQVQRACPGCVPSVTEIPNLLSYDNSAVTGLELPSLDGAAIDTQGGVKDGTQRGDGRTGGSKGSTDGQAGSGVLGDPVDPALPGDGGSTDGGSGNALTDTVDSLTDTLLGDDGTTSGGATSGGDSSDDGLLDQLDQSLEDTTGGLLNP